MRPALLLGIWAVIFLPELYAQPEPYHFELYSVQDGLCHNRLTSLIQDEDGFLWIGSENGISRFDGVRFQNFYPIAGDSTSLKSGSIVKSGMDHSGIIWFNTINGISIYDPAKGGFKTFFAYPEYFNKLYEASDSRKLVQDGKIWFIRPDQAFGFQDCNTAHSGKLAFSTEDNQETDLLVMGFLPKGEKSFWVATGNGMRIFDLERAKMEPLQNELALNGPLLLESTDQGIFYSQWHEGLSFFDLESGKSQSWKLVTGAKLPNIVHSLLRLNPKEWWLGTEGGLYLLNPQTGENRQIILPNETDYPLVIKALLLDHSGNIWVATENGLLKMDPRLQGFHYQKVVFDPEPVFENQIYQVVELQEAQKTIVVSRGGNLYEIGKTGQVKKIPIFSNMSAEPTGLFQRKKNEWYLTTRASVYKFDPDNYHSQQILLPQRRENRRGLFWVTAKDHKERIWFGLSRDGLMLYDPAKGKGRYLTCAENNFCALNIWTIQIDTLNKKIWVGADWEGLWEGDLETLQFKRIYPESDRKLPSQQILSLAQDKEGYLWIGTPLGLCRYDWFKEGEEKLNCLTLDSGLPAHYVESLTLDLQGYLWGGAGDKLVKIDPMTFATEVYDHNFGVNFTPFPISSINLGASGKMYAGGKRGYLSWDPSKLIPDTIKPKLYLTQIKVLGKPLDSDLPPENIKKLKLKHFQNSITFEFAGLDFTLPKQNQYTWKLEGFDKHWNKGSHGTAAIYSRIPPGKYVFKLRNLSKSGAFIRNPDSDEGLDILLNIRPSFWQTLWVKLLFVGIIIGILTFWYKFRLRQLQEKEILRAAFQKKIAELEMTALRAQMKPHFVFNCLNSINRFIQLSDPDTASDYLTKFSRLIRLVLDNSKEETVPLDREIQALQLYVELESLRFSGRFRYVFNIDEQLDLSGIDIPPLLIQPIIENGIWHGLMHKEGNDGLLSVDFSQEGTFLKITIADNGVGRAASALLKSKSATKHKSRGMEMTNERLNYIRQVYHKKVSVEVGDLVDSGGEAAGTEVILRIEIG